MIILLVWSGFSYLDATVLTVPLLVIKISVVLIHNFASAAEWFVGIVLP